MGLLNAYYFFLSGSRKKKDNKKERLPAAVPELKKEYFPKQKELARAQTAFCSLRKMLLFSLCSSTKCRSSNGECNIALFVEEDGSKYDVIEILPSNGRIDDRSHFLGVKRRERDGTLKRKSCLSVASSFSLVESPTGVAKKVQP